ncbi:Aste57867_11438 [Aphanomyces stellatus]|uniref:Aste57867_11438 protein n=1 Tax=Aphanomyces stellatus TaxID=120398 RepID=A0A485KSZ8_9STRA|nr:hypothetical protein As57867_011396 [Aphanomyces stellatus]VFT88299.1 Aste57867_11438 [Aphanomyces stellatus]
MLLTVDGLLELASKAPPRTLAEHMAVVDAMKADGILLPELAQLNQEIADEVHRHERVMDDHERRQLQQEEEEHASTKDIAPEQSPPKPKSPRLRRKASAPDLRPLVAADDQVSEVDTSMSSPTPPMLRQPITPRVSYQSIFLAAAIQLLESSPSMWQHEPTARVPLPPDTILAGYLKKAKDNSLRSCTKKFVVLTRGVLTTYSDVGLMEKAKVQTLVLVRFVCREVLSQRFQHKFAFELIATDAQKTKSKVVWMAKSEQERRVWVHAIRAVINEPYQSIGPALEGDCYECLLLRRQVQGATEKASYLKALQQSKKELRMPVEWIHRQEAAARHPRSRCGMDQVFKDLERDKVKINNRVLSGAEGSECVLGALTRVFMQVQAQHDEHKDLSEAQALCIVRSLLLSCNRTQSGGDTYEAVEFLYHNPALNVLCPHQLEAEPLEINVYLHDACPSVTQYEPDVDATDHWRESVGSNGGGHVRHYSGGSIPIAPTVFEDTMDGVTKASPLHLFGKDQREDPPLLVFAGKKMHISIVASTSYKVCDLNPQGHMDDDTWAVIDAVFEQAFVYVPQYGVLEGKGSVRVKHKK